MNMQIITHTDALRQRTLKRRFERDWESDNLKLMILGKRSHHEYAKLNKARVSPFRSKKITD